MQFNGKKLGEDVKTKRAIKMRISLGMLSLELGVSPSTLSRIENGHEPDINTFATVCEWLGAKMEKYFTK